MTFCDILLPWPDPHQTPPDLPEASVGLLDWLSCAPCPASCPSSSCSWTTCLEEVSRRVKSSRAAISRLLYEAEPEVQIMGGLEAAGEVLALGRLFSGCQDGVEEEEGRAGRLARVRTGVEDCSHRVGELRLDLWVEGLLAREQFRTGQH